MSISTKSNDRKRYSVGSSCSHFAYADTIKEAKQAGEDIAKKEAYRGKWNIMYLQIDIRKADTIKPYFSYGKPIYSLFVPVRGTGVRIEHIINEIINREHINAFQWKHMV